MVDTPALFAEYAAYHQSPINRATHFIGLPLIGLSVFALIHQLPHPTLGAIEFRPAWIALALFCLAGFVVDWRLALINAVLATGLFVMGLALPVPVLLAAFALGVLVPVGGHVFWERKWPDTPRRFARFELVGHLWFLNEVFPVVQRASSSSATTGA